MKRDPRCLTLPRLSLPALHLALALTLCLALLSPAAPVPARANSTSPTAAKPLPLEAAGTTTTLESSRVVALVGQPVIFTATVASKASTPTGSVSFFAGGALLGSADLASGRVSFASSLAQGTHVVTASYAGIAGFKPSSSLPLWQLVAPYACAGCALGSPADFATGAWARSVVVADFNADGKQDLAVANASPSNVSVLLGDGAGSFAAAANHAVSSGPQSLAAGDFNVDGKPDLATADYYAGTVSILLGTGEGGFGAASHFNAGLYPRAVAVGDFDRDGKQDLAVRSGGSSSVSILPGNGDGSFGEATAYAAGSSFLWSVAVGDFNADGKQDLAVANGGVYVLLGNAAGGFGAAAPFPVGANGATSVAVGDFNGDGKENLAAANITFNTVSILLGDGSGGFGTHTPFPVGSAARFVAVGDFNADGKQDLATANQTSNNVSILAGNGDGSFGGATTFAIGSSTYPFALAAGDFNSDGKQDLAVANENSGNVSVLLNVCLAATSTSLESSPNPSKEGQGVTFTARVTSAGGAPGGQVTFYDGGTSLGTVDLAAGRAVFTTSALAVGTHVMTAAYGGNAGFGASTSAALNHAVEKWHLYLPGVMR